MQNCTQIVSISYLLELGIYQDPPSILTMMLPSLLTSWEFADRQHFVESKACLKSSSLYGAILVLPEVAWCARAKADQCIPAELEERHFLIWQLQIVPSNLSQSMVQGNLEFSCSCTQSQLSHIETCWGIRELVSYLSVWRSTMSIEVTKPQGQCSCIIA